MHGVVTLVPLTTKSQPDNPLAYPFSSPLRGEITSWAVCSHVATLAVSRLVPPSRKIPKVDRADFAEILRFVHSIIPTPDP